MRQILNTNSFRLFLLCMVTYGFFSSIDNPNIISRVALTLAIVQRQELTIDPLARFTVDKAVVNGSYYSDKAPGLSLMAVPAAYVVATIFDRDDSGKAWVTAEDRPSLKFSLLVYVLTLCTVSLLAALAVVAAYRWTLSRGASDRAALIAAVTLGFATPTWGWATVFLGHAACGALLLLGFIGLSTAMEPGRLKQGAPAWRAGLAGLALGTAFIVELTAGPAVAIIGVCCGVVALARPDRWTLVLRVFVPAAAGLALPLALLLTYNFLAFNSPLKLGYENVQGFPGMQTGFFGISRPNPAVALELLIGWYRGLLPLSPVLALFPLAAALGLRDRAYRLATVVAVLVFAYYLAMNAGYFYWDGGAAIGPRHLVPTLPFLALPMARLWDAGGRVLRGAFLLLLAVSIGLSLVCVATEMFPREDIYPRPLTELLLPKLLSGDLHRAVIARLPGINGAPVLLPLLLAWAVIGWSLLRKPTGDARAA